MMAALDFLWPPFLVAFCLVGIHAYFGIQVLTRNIVFVDLALAQIAARRSPRNRSLSSAAVVSRTVSATRWCVPSQTRCAAAALAHRFAGLHDAGARRQNHHPPAA